MSVNTGAPEPVGLFEFLRVLEVAGHRKKLTRMQERIARLTALDSNTATGSGVVINAARTALELGISERSVWIHFSALCEAGWFVQTVAPTRSSGKTPGRRARYQCTRPPLDLGLLPIEYLAAEIADGQLPIDLTEDRPVDNSNRVQKSGLAPSTENDDSHMKVRGGESANDRPTPAESSEGFDHNRLKVLAESSEGPERENCTHSSSCGTPSNVTPTGLPQLGKPQTAREKPVDKPSDDDWLAPVREKLAAAVAAHARHARPAPVGNVRPDGE